MGDTLFAGSIGRTDLPGGDYERLMRSITEVLFPLGDAAIVHPGHGPDTTIAPGARDEPVRAGLPVARASDAVPHSGSTDYRLNDRTTSSSRVATSSTRPI